MIQIENSERTGLRFAIRRFHRKWETELQLLGGLKKSRKILIAIRLERFYEGFTSIQTVQ